jgi:transcriptional regulator with XRE-family HTH domain
MTSREKLGHELRRLRIEAGFSGAEAARRAGLSQPRVSRMELGSYAPVVDAVDALCQLYKASAAKRKDLVALAHALSEDELSASAPRVVVQHNPARIQERIGKVERESSLIRAFHPSVVIGLVQTTDYIRTVFGGEFSSEVANKAIEARSKRQKILDSRREFVLLMSEGALRWHMGSPSIMVGQLEHLIDVTRLSNVTLGIVPWTTPSRITPVHGFHIYDSHTVATGLTTGQIVISNPREVLEYESLFSELEGIAVFNDDARSVIRRVASDFRKIL